MRTAYLNYLVAGLLLGAGIAGRATTGLDIFTLFIVPGAAILGFTHTIAIFDELK